MKLKDAFEEIFTGYNMTNAIGNNKDIKEVNFINKDSIAYTNIIPKRLILKQVTTDIKNKYYMKDRDIIISLKKPYKVGTYRFNRSINIVIPNNFIILRGINMDKYSFIFVANYLEKIGISKFVKEHDITGDLTVSLKDLSANSTGVTNLAPSLVRCIDFTFTVPVPLLFSYVLAVILLIFLLARSTSTLSILIVPPFIAKFWK